MATLVLSAAGAAIGGGIGGTVLGLSGAVIGRAVGATLGRAIDQKIMGSGAQAVEGPRLDRLRLTATGEGAAIANLWGRMRIGGHVIWASQFEEHQHQHRQRGGKGSSRTVNEYSYTVSLAIGLCLGPILTIGRIWADGQEISPQSLNLRLYEGHETQQPDPKIEALEGPSPAFRGLAYVVIEDLDLTPFGNRVPQFSFEVMRETQGAEMTQSRAITAVAMIPGTGEYSLSTQNLYHDFGLGETQAINTNTPSGKSDFLTSLDQLNAELPQCKSVSLIVSWFGNDLRASHCQILPKVEQNESDAKAMAWRVGGLTRADAPLVPQIEGRPAYGGSPSDQSVIEAIRALKNSGKEVMFYPFILMDQQAGNQLPNPYNNTLGQPVMPWRGRITSQIGPGRANTTDRTASARAEVAAFFGTAAPNDFVVQRDYISAPTAPDWGLRRFILHYAHLCKLAGGVDAFCIGSEMVGLTRIRDDNDAFPAVEALCTLAAEVKAILGASCKVSYAADWSEYSSYSRDGNLYFPLDPLWAHPAIDFIGIDNYMPLSDWRDEPEHRDAKWQSIYSLDYLTANIAGGELYDWYYDGPADQAVQNRRPITDGAYDEPWVYRLKDLRSWWANRHHTRENGVRSPTPTAWQAQSKPIRFTEYGCAAIDKGTNEPNKFLDLHSSESVLPRGSLGGRDDLIQMQYYRAMARYWRQTRNNPISTQYQGHMVEFDYAHAWAWDARPFPAFPARADMWSDGQAYGRGHWLNGRVTNQSLSAVIADIASDLPANQLDLSQVHGIVRGYHIAQIQSPRASLQPLLLAHALDPVERDGQLRLIPRRPGIDHTITADELALEAGKDDSHFEHSRQARNEAAGILNLSHIEAEGDFNPKLAQIQRSEGDQHNIWQSELALSLTGGEGKAIAARWLAEAQISKDRVRFNLAPSRRDVGPGDRLSLPDGSQYRVEQIEIGHIRQIDASRIEGQIYQNQLNEDETIRLRPYTAPTPVRPIFMDLPLLSGTQSPHQPYLAISAKPWPGTVGVWAAQGAQEDESFDLEMLMTKAAIVGRTQSPLYRARPGLWDQGPGLRVKLTRGALQSLSRAKVLNGANAVAIGSIDDPNAWEVFQFSTANLIGPNLYSLSDRLRGQCGSDGIMPDVWPQGSVVVVLDKAVEQINLRPNMRAIAQRYRIGPTKDGLDGPSIIEQTHSFRANGLRPYRVAHLRAQPQNGGHMVSWIRRSRIDGDDWGQIEIPLGEERELYTLEIWRGAQRLAHHDLSAPQMMLSSTALAGFGGAAGLRISVAQISMRYGAGPAAQLGL